MRIEIEIKKVVEAKTLHVLAGVRYWEDATVDGVEVPEDGTGMPRKLGDKWMPVIDVDSGVIQHWPKGTIADIHFNVCDNFSCQLFDAEGDPVHHFEGYVPGFMSPAENGFGDYIIMKVDGDGKIDKWKFDFRHIAESD